MLRQSRVHPYYKTSQILMRNDSSEGLEAAWQMRLVGMVWMLP